MKITRRGLAGVAAGAVAATQMDKAKINLAPPKMQVMEKNYFDEDSHSTKTDPEYWQKQITHCKKILAGDFSDCLYQFEDYTRGRMHTDIDCLKSVSASGKQHFIENAFNKRKKRELIESAKEQLDEIMGLPFSVTGLFFK